MQRIIPEITATIPKAEITVLKKDRLAFYEDAC